MKKQRRLKKGLAILLTAAMVVGLVPGMGTLQVSATEPDENTVNTVSSNEAMTPEQTEGKLITAWQWIDEEEILDEETGNLALPGANAQTPAYFDDVISFLPTRIQATVGNAEDSENSENGAEETITLGDWECDNYPEEGAYSGSYTFAASLPEGYALSEEAEELTITVELGGAAMWSEESGITYRTCDSNGQNWTTETCASATEVTDADTEWGTSDTDTWYVVNGTMNIGSSSSKIRISVSGNVHLILTDECSLTINGGIEVTDGNSLTIYGQAGDTGSLLIQNVDNSNAGIGSASGTKCGTITINGGKVNVAKSGYNGAGIGSGYQGDSGTITINGGTVTATGYGYSAGIGGGDRYSGGTITINGGTVTATGGSSGGAGIGGGEFGDGGSITINGGTVNATGGSSGGAGIGGGIYAGGGNITINGGTVNATGGSSGGAGIGGGAGGASGAGGSGGTITISGGTVTATGGTKGGAGIGGGGYSSGTGGSGGSINISGGNVTATGGADGGAGIGDGNNGSGGTVAISNSFVMASSISDTSNQESWNGLVFEGGSGKAYGTLVNVTTDCTIPSEKTLEVAADQTISIADTKTLTNEGTIYNNGTFSGTVTNTDSGIIHNTGTISGASGGTINHYSIERTETSCQSVGLSLKVNDTTFEDTVTYTLSDGESNVEIEYGNTLKVTDNGGRISIPVTATFTVDSVSMTRTENVTVTGHVLAYAVNSQTTGTSSIKVTCDKCVKEFGTVTLSAPTMDLTYDGNAKTATVGTSGVTGVTISTPTITYKQGETILSSAPVDAGTYTASITLGTGDNAATVSVEYTIEQATPTISWGMSSGGNWVEVTEIPVTYTGSEIAPDKPGVTPTVTLVNGETYSGEISYSYRAQGSSDAFASGLPTEIGTYEVKASIAADGNYKEAASTVKLTVNWFNTLVEAVLTDQKNVTLSGDDWWAQSVTFTAPNSFTISNSLTDSFGTFFEYNEQTGADGTEVTYYLKNENGEIAKKTTTVRIDKTAPDWSGENDGISIKTNKWKSLLSTISFGLFYKETVDVEVRASDSLSGVAAYYYYVDSTGGTVKTAEQLDALNFTEYTDGVSGQNPTVTVTSLAPDGNYIVYAYAVDAAGNRSAYVCSEGVVVDSTAPAISNIVAPSKEASTLTDTTAQISFTGSEAGTYFYMVKESSVTAPTTITDFATEQANDGYSSWTAKQGVSYTAMTADERNTVTLTGLEANTEYTLYLAAVDLAGNSIQTIASKTFTTCKTMPTVADADMPKISGTYGQTVADMTLTPGTAKVGSTVITGAWTVTDSSKTDTPSVGTTATYQVTFTPDNGMYDTVNVQVTPTVAQKVVTVTAENKTKTYGKNNPDLTFTVPEGALVGTDTEDDLGVTLSCEATAVSPVKEGGYAITGTSSSANYNVTVTPGTLTIEKADATITVGTDTYSKTFGDAAFNLSDVTDTNTEANVQYEVTAGDAVSVSNGTVTILKAGTATITVSLPESTNYNAAEDKTITVTVEKKSGYTVADINKSYLYSRNNADTIDLSKYLPANFGTVTYGTPQTSGTVNYTVSPAVADGKLSYTVKTGSVGDTGTIQVAVTTENYADFTLTVKVNLTDKIPVTLSGVTCGNRAYNGTAYAYTGTPVWKTEEGVTATGDTTVTYYKAEDPSTPVAAPTNAGSYRAVFTITSDDYVGTASYSFEITKAEITVAAKDRNIYTGDTVPDLTNPTVGTDYIVTGLCGTDVLGGTAIMSYGQTPDNTKAGTYEILISGLTVPEGDNYTITFTKGTLTITTKPSGGGGSSSGGSSGGSSSDSGSTGEVTTGKDSENNVTTTTTPTEVKVENGTASATVKTENVTEAIKQAADNQSAQIVFTVSETDTGNADKIQLSMTTSDVKQILDKTDADLVVATTAGDVILPQETLKEVVSAAGGNDITIEIDKVTTPTAVQKEAAGENGYIVEVTIASQNKAITTFGGNTLKIRLEIPASLTGKGVAVIHIAEDGKTEKMPGKIVTEGTKQYYEFPTTHLSTFALIEDEEQEETPTVSYPKKGTILTGSKTKMMYKITKSGLTGGTVQFIGTKNKTATTITIPATVTFGGITYKVTSIAAGALKNNKVITKVVIGKNVTVIGTGAFSGCTKLKSVTIGKGVVSINSKAFYNCTSLTTLTIPASVTKIWDYAFKGCSKLSTLKINSTKLTTKTLSALSMKGISTKTVIKVPKSKVKTYAALFVKKGLSKKVTVKSL